MFIALYLLTTFFLCIPATVASAERSFRKLKLIKNYLRNTMTQHRLVDLVRLNIECKLARKINFDDVVKTFAAKKAHKPSLNK